MSGKKVKLGTVLKQYRIEHWVQNEQSYKQVTISKYDGVSYRGKKLGKEIGRKRQFIIDLKKYPNTLLFVRQGVQDGSIGIAPLEVDGCIVTENMPMFSIEGIEVDYLNFLIKSPLFRYELNELVPTGSAQKSIHERQLLEIQIPLPSRTEQKEINFSLNNFETEYQELQKELDQQQAYINLLRQTILQEAVQGKLTKQNTKDEPATELLKRIKAEKEKLIKAGKLKKEKELPSITEDEIPFELPQGWVWCRLGELINVGSSKRIYASDYKKSGIPFYRSMEIGQLGENKEIKIELFISEDKFNQIKKVYGVPKAGDILIACIGGSIGNTWVVDDRTFYYKDGNLVLLESIPEIQTKYLLGYLKSELFMQSAMERVLGSAYNALTIIKIKNSLFPLPPLPEQLRIVTKVQQLQEQLSQLETQVQQSRQYAQQLLQSVLKEAFEQKEKVYEENEELTLVAEK